MPNQLPQRKQKSKFATIQKNIKSTFKRTPHRPTGQANNLPTRGPASTPLSSRGFLTLPSSRATPPQPEGHEQSLNKEGPPKSAPKLIEARAESIVYTTPPPPQPHPPPPSPPGAARAPGLSLAPRRAVPFPPSPRQPGDPTTERLVRGEAASGDRREPAGAGAVPQGTGGSILISISAPPSSFSASRASSSPVVSWDQLIGVNFSQLRLPGRREQCSPGRDEREGVESYTGEGGEGRAQLPGKCSSTDVRLFPPSRKLKL